MDNRINEIRRKISALGAEMLAIEDTIRDQINHDLDCTEASLRLMVLRREMVELLHQRKIAGDDDSCPTVEERLKENYRSPVKRNRPLRGLSSAASGTVGRERADEFKIRKLPAEILVLGSVIGQFR
jgi:hypothetical protein